MEAREQLRQYIISRALGSFSVEFLSDLQRASELAYLDTFAQVRHDKTILKEQQIHKLRQDRCFRMDFELCKIGNKHGLKNTAKKLSENDWAFAYAVSGDFGVTQSYVQSIGELPNPAKYRDKLAEASMVPRLSLENDSEFYKPKNFYGLFAHNPVGLKFEPEKQMLGSLQLCVPVADMKSWALEISIAELISMYPVSVAQIGIAKTGPTWKKPLEEEKRG